jgi:hypothetical protein
MNKTFKEINEGESFVFQNKEFKKIRNIKVSCCRSYNAESTSDASQKIFVKPDEQVETND